MPVATFDIRTDSVASFQAEDVFLMDKVDDGPAVPETGVDEFVGAVWGNSVDKALRQLNEMCQGAAFIDGLGVGVLPSTASASADDIVAGGSTSPGISIIESGNGGTCKLLFGNSGSNADAGFTYNSTFDSLVLHTAGATRSYWGGTTFAHYQANALIQVGLNDTPGSAGDPLVVLYKGAGNAAISAYHSDQGGTFQRRMDDGIGSAEDGFRRIYDSTGTLVGTTTWAAGATTVTFPGLVGVNAGGVYLHTTPTTDPPGNFNLSNGSQLWQTTPNIRWVQVASSQWIPVERVARVQTTDGTTTTLAAYTIASDNVAVAVDCLVVAMQSDGSQRNVYIRRACAYRDGGGATLTAGGVDAPWTDESAGAWDCTIDVNGNDARVRVTGAAATTINWTATITMTETR